MPFERVPCFLGRGRCGADRPADPLRSGAQVHTLNQTDRFVEVIDSLLKLLMPGVPLRELEFCAASEASFFRQVSPGSGTLPGLSSGATR